MRAQLRGPFRGKETPLTNMGRPYTASLHKAPSIFFLVTRNTSSSKFDWLHVMAFDDAVSALKLHRITLISVEIDFGSRISTQVAT